LENTKVREVRVLENSPWKGFEKSNVGVRWKMASAPVARSK